MFRGELLVLGSVSIPTVPYKDHNMWNLQKSYNTVDGRNPAPVDMVKYLIVYKLFYTSQVVQDFFHQQYVFI